MRALVTGAAGFIGSHLAERLLDQGAEVVAVDAFTNSYPRWIKELNVRRILRHPACTFIEGDLAQMELQDPLKGVEQVFHQAAWAGVRSSWGSAFEVYVRNNVLSTQRLLEAAKDASISKFIFASSSSIYGDAETFPTSETAVPRPTSPYGVTKLAAEHLCYLYRRRFGIPVVSLRYFTVFGPRQRPDMAFQIFIRGLLMGQSIEIFGDGEQTRDFTYVDDIVTANLLAAEKGRLGRVYNIAGGVEVTVNEVVRTLSCLTGKIVPVHNRQTQGGDARRTAADTSLARAALGYEPMVGLEEGLKREVGWVREVLLSHPP